MSLQSLIRRREYIKIMIRHRDEISRLICGYDSTYELCCSFTIKTISYHLFPDVLDMLPFFLFWLIRHIYICTICCNFHLISCHFSFATNSNRFKFEIYIYIYVLRFLINLLSPDSDSYLIVKIQRTWSLLINWLWQSPFDKRLNQFFPCRKWIWQSVYEWRRNWWFNLLVFSCHLISINMIFCLRIYDVSGTIFCQCVYDVSGMYNHRRRLQTTMETFRLNLS